MASLRDVLNHIGRPVVVLRDGRESGRGVGIARPGEALLEAGLDVRAGDELRFDDTGHRFRVASVEDARAGNRVDHRRARIEAA